MIAIRQLIISVTFILSACTNNHNKMIEWADKIAIGSSVQSVKQIQPDYLKIDWNKPDTLHNGFIRFYITDIDGNYDALKMSYFLEFDSSGYRGQFSRK